MKKQLKIITFFVIVFCTFTNAQKLFNHVSISNYSSTNKLPNDSLKGFDEEHIKMDILHHNLSASESQTYIESLKREFIKNKFLFRAKQPGTSNVSTFVSDQKTIGSDNSINSITPCTNMDFELSFPGTYTSATAVSGWSISSQFVNSCTTSAWVPGSTEFSVHSTPVYNVPYIGTLQQSPLGGTKILQLNNYSQNQNCTKITRTINVTPGNSIFQFAYAGILQDGTHNCCEQALFCVQFKTCPGAIIPCLTYSVNGTLAPSPCFNSPILNYVVAYPSSSVWTDWRVKNIDLSPYIGSCLQLEVIVSDCVFSQHYGTIFFDAVCSPSPTSPFISGNNNSGYISFCPGTNSAVITAPAGYESYHWYPSYPFNTNTLSVLTTTYLSASTYTVIYNNGNTLCSISHTYAVQPSSVNIAGIGSSSTCSLAAGGSASVQVIGSNAGYSYSWINSGNSVVGTNSVVTNLSIGIYSITVSALNCGSTIATVTISSTPPQTNYLLKPYCGATAYFQSIPGSNFQWYNGLNPIPSGMGGTAPGYTLSAPVNNSYYSLAYIDVQGCKDSTIYNLISSVPGHLASISVSTLCPGLPVNPIISLSSSAFSPPAISSFTIVSVNPAPSYSAVYNTISANIFTVTNLIASSSYSIIGFDGSCYLDTIITMPSIIPPVNYTLTPSSSSVCSGNDILANLTSSSSPFPVTWSPAPTSQSHPTSQVFLATLTPTTAPGLTSTFVYSVFITENPSNCIFTLTLPVTVSNFVTPTINPIASLCSNSGTYGINVQPTGGSFVSAPTNSNVISMIGGIITPSLASNGTNTFLYLLSGPGCSVSSTGSFVVNSPPGLHIKADSLICAGETSFLNASGANLYNWNNGITTNINAVTPTLTTSYTVTGTNSITSCTNTKTVTVIVNSCTSLNELKQGQEFKIYPNPVSDKLFFETSREGTLLIYNSLGQLVLEKLIPTGNTAINIDEFNNGMYFIKIIPGNTTETLRLIKIGNN